MVSRRERGAWPAVLVAALGAGCGGDGGAPLNLLVVLVDTARADHVGYHDYARPTTPFLDTLAVESTAFLRHHSHASRTGPSVASVFTGLHPRSHGVLNPLDVRDGKGTLAADQVTLAELLTRAGYSCHGVVGNPNVNPKLGFGQGFASYARERPGRAENITERGLEILAEVEEPFFRYLHYMDPHSTYGALPPHAGLFADPAYTGAVNGETRQLNEVVSGELAFGADDLAQLIALYDEEYRAFDAGLEQLVGALRSDGRWERTAFAFVSDHGEELLDHGSALHGYTLYQEQLHVPFLVRDPRAPARREVDAISRHVDVLPTLLDLLGVGLPRRVQGTSLAPLVRGEGAPEEDVPVYAQASIRAVKTVALESFAEGGWKIIRHSRPELREELYHLEVDPGEQRDVAGERPDELRRMRERMEAFRDALPVATGGTVTLTEEEIEELRALGYVR